MFVRGSNPIWFFVDLIGQPLNDQYWIFFLQNTFPYLPSPVYQDQNGFVEWPDPLEFYPNGTLPDNLYFNDSLVYRIEIRKGPTQNDPLIYEINNFIPGSNVTPPNETSSGTDNQVSNPQFAFVSFNGSATYDAAGTYEVAPDWFLQLTGSGTATVTQVQTITGSQNIIDNPPYALNFNLTGWSAASLYQRYHMNGALWASTLTQNGSVSMSVTAEATAALGSTLTLSYRPSVGAVQIVASGPISVGSYADIVGAVIIGPSTNTDLSASAYVDLLVTLPPLGIYNITNLQLIGNGNAGTTPLPITYEQETVERARDQLFHYYYNSIILEPKDDILTGWNFSLNPWQFSSTTLTTIAPLCSYVTDQTILYQKTASSVQVGQDLPDNNFALRVQALLSTNQFALIQYIAPQTIMPYWTQYVSSLVNALLDSGVSSTIRFKMRLIYNPALPVLIGNTEPILSWSGTDPIFSSNWTEIIPQNDPVYTLNSIFTDFSFDKIQLPSIANSTATLGIVIYTLDNMSSSGTPDFIDFRRVSLVPNEFAIDSSPLTFDQSLRRCQFYYEKSYEEGTLPGTISGISELAVPQNLVFNGSSIWSLFATPYTINYSSVKCSPAIAITSYSPSTGAVSTVDVRIVNGATLAATGTAAISNWVASTGVGTKRTAYFPTNANLLIATGASFSSTSAMCGYLTVHYTIDSRLGVF